MKAISEGNGSFGKLVVTLTRAIMVAGCFFWAASTLAQTLSVQSDATQSAQPDSIVQLTADAQGLPLLSPDAVPASGTFWLVMPGIDGGVTAPMPCPPKDTSFPIYQIANGQFLVDATGGQVAVSPQFAGQRIAASTVTDALEQEASSVVNLITRIQTSEADQQTRATMQAMGMDVPSPGDGGTNSFTPDGAGYIAPSYGTNLWIAQVTMLSGNLNGIGTNTQAGIQYDIMSRTNLIQTDWQYESSIYGSETTNWTPLTVSQNGRPILFLRLRSDVDDGSGLPLWWQLQYFGVTGVDPYGNPAGDGWSNIQKFQNGMNPNVFYTPAAPQGLTATYNASTGTANISWLPSAGAVTGYILTTPGGTVNLSAANTSYADHDPSLGLALTYPFDYGYPSFGLVASYTGGNSASASVNLAGNNLFFGNPNIQLVQGAQGSNFLAVSALPTGTAAIRLIREDEYAESWYDDISFNASNNVPVSSFTNGLGYVPPGLITAPMDAYGNTTYFWWAQTVNANGGANSPIVNLGQTSGTNAVTYGIDAINPLYADGRVQMKEDLIFQLRAAMMDFPFGYYVGNDYYNLFEFTYPATYAYSGFYQTFDQYGHPQAVGTFDPFLPFENNYFYRNFVFNLSDVNQGFPTTGIWGGDTPYLAISNSSVAYQFQPPTVNGTTIPSLLSTNDARWLGTGDYIYGSTWIYSPIEEIGMSQDGSGYYHLSGSNYFGLPFQSVEIAYPSGSGTATTTLNAGGSTAQGGYFYAETAQPKFQTVGYDFWNGVWINPTPPPLPGTTGFTLTNTGDLLIVPVGGGVSIAGYAKLAVTNGYSGVYGYLGQYFDKAYTMTNGVVTANTTGVLSPYGQFLATYPGPAALMTMPDPNTGARGTCAVYCVSLALDANHDGNMDLSWSGPDATSESSPYVFWANNNYDRFTLDDDDGIYYDDDVLNTSHAATCPYTPNTPTPDCNYRDGAGNRVIPCARDLQDFFRLWICGITTNLLNALPPNSTVTLSWQPIYTRSFQTLPLPTIDLFAAADPDGGIGYLTNSTAADEQIDSAYCPYIGRLGPSGSIQLNAIQFANGWAGNHFIMCGVSNGTGGLNLTIQDGSGNVLAQSTTYLQIVDIKQMYERWTIGDVANATPKTNAVPATEDLPPFTSAFQYTQPTDTNTPYILYVHGWNMDRYDKDRFAEAAFKRLYWQGYHGRFGVFRWPTDYDFNATLMDALFQPHNYDGSEYTAWQSAQGLVNKLKDLNAEYPGHVYVLAHSMGNVVTGEALRQAAQQGLGQLVNTYVASQAAIPAHVYDATVTSPYLIDYTHKNPSYPFSAPGAPKTPNIYGNRLTNNIAAVGHRISFYNVNDYALSPDAWCFDQELKPDTFIGSGYYFYAGSTNDPAPWNNFEYVLNVGNPLMLDIVNNLNDRYEALAYAANPYSRALGSTPNVLNISQNLDLTTVWLTDTSGHNYADHFWHSAEFRGDYWQEQGYWHTLLFSSTYGFNISNP